MKTFILTGATSDICKEIIHKIENLKDTDIICSYRNKQKFNNMYPNYNKKEFDIYEDINLLVKNINDRTEEIVLILAAFSIEPIKKIGSFSEREIDDAIRINVIFNTKILNIIINYCNKNNLRLRIVNFDSGAADFALQGWANYCAGKSYINSFLRCVIEENPNFKVVSFDPGVVNTKMQSIIRNTSDKIFDKVKDFIEYKEKGLLNESKDVAKYVFENYIINWNCKDFREKFKR